MMQAGDMPQAELLLTKLVGDLPDFADFSGTVAWNRRAVLYYCVGEYRKSLADCQRAIALNGVHFGALHGLGLCHAALGEYQQAIAARKIGAFRRALEIQPYALDNQRFILECTLRLK